MSTDVTCPDELWANLDQCNEALRQVLADPALKRKERTDAIREKEAPVLLALGQMANHVETTAACKSDVFTTGFRPHNEHRKLREQGVETRRRQRVSAKLEQLQNS
ncbi:MAG: hypothetical protein JNK89_10310 [Saprospiraceae bacterium]|nr:hypothetical protein [Saprospiraceae bacterium]